MLKWQVRFSICIGVLFSVTLFADDKKIERVSGDDDSDASFEKVLDIDVTGRPRFAPNDGTKFYIWHDGDGWHLRTNTKAQPQKKKKKALQTFSGTIQVDAGRVTKLQMVGGLETKGKGKDPGWISPQKKTIKFEFVTSPRGEDGFDFQVTDLTKAVRFDLRIGGYDHPNQIALGAGKQPAPAGQFVLKVPNKAE